MRLTHYDELKERWQINNDYGTVMIDELNYAVGKAIDKLAAYEDIGLSPEEIKLNMDGLDEYHKAEAEGRLVILPCKAGDTVYKVSVNTEACCDCDHYSDFYGMDAMCDINLDALHPRFPDKPLCEKQFFEIRQYQVHILRDIDAIGKTVFLTREEAEAALKGGQDDASNT